MSELGQNFFTKEWVIIATERARWPEEMATQRAAQPIPEFVESCPFCPANESKTPPEVMRVSAGKFLGGAGDSQQVRGFVERGPAHTQLAAPAAAHRHLRVSRRDH